ncbi:MAG: carboxypeptidase [Verrucomicrobia bacterium]|nr:carboxypeptidase [Verrucomicrobiota bacterium]
MAIYDPKKYLNYAEMSELLKSLSRDFADLCLLESIGKTLQGRDIWLMTITDQKKIAPQEKPAYWVDGNTHAGEVAGTQACLHLIHKLLHSFGKDRVITQLLEEQTFYIVPRISADGAEVFFSSPHRLRSAPVDWPNKDIKGLDEADIDNDGHIVKMRVKDPNGQWRQSEKDPRIMLYRRPDEDDPNTTYYRMYSEGLFEDYDGFKKIVRPYRWSLDLNRNYPINWRPEGEQVGAGPYPLSQPESRSLLAAITARPNIVGMQSFHGYGNVILRPSMSKPDLEIDEQDLHAFESLGRRGEEITGYRAISVFHNFRYSQRSLLGGNFNDWAYDAQGYLVFSNEIWSLPEKAGVKIENPGEQYCRELPEQDQLRILTWCDDNLPPGSFYKLWQTFQHPQLGEVEIGGWLFKYTWTNPPPQFLPEEVEKNANFVIACAKANPRIKIYSANSEIVSNGVRKLTLIIENSGYLPTYGTNRARLAKTVHAPRVQLALAQGQRLIAGEADFEISHLGGRSNLAYRANFYGFRGASNDDQLKLEWVIEGSGPVTVTVNFQKAGTVRHMFDG